MHLSKTQLPHSRWCCRFCILIVIVFASVRAHLFQQTATSFSTFSKTFLTMFQVGQWDGACSYRNSQNFIFNNQLWLIGFLDSKTIINIPGNQFLLSANLTKQAHNSVTWDVSPHCKSSPAPAKELFLSKTQPPCSVTDHVPATQAVNPLVILLCAYATPFDLWGILTLQKGSATCAAKTSQKHQLRKEGFSVAINFDVIMKRFCIKITVFRIFLIPQNSMIFFFYTLCIQKHAYCSVQRHYSLVFPLF